MVGNSDCPLCEDSVFIQSTPAHEPVPPGCQNSVNLETIAKASLVPSLQRHRLGFMPVANFFAKKHGLPQEMKALAEYVGDPSLWITFKDLHPHFGEYWFSSQGPTPKSKRIFRKAETRKTMLQDVTAAFSKEQCEWDYQLVLMFQDLEKPVNANPLLKKYDPFWSKIEELYNQQF